MFSLDWNYVEWLQDTGEETLSLPISMKYGNLKLCDLYRMKRM